MRRKTELDVPRGPLEPTEGSGRIYRQIAERIRLGIADGRFPPGRRLPAERDLARQFEVSRTSVREALIALEIGGFVEVRLGSGIYVAESLPFMRPLFEAVDAGPGPFELLRARWVVEGEVAGWAARVIDDAGLARLTRAFQTLQAAESRVGEQDDADREFHLGIAEATGNGALIQTVRMYWDQRHGPMWQKLVEHFRTPALRALILNDHREILMALQARSPLRARQAMRRHLAHVTREFARSPVGEASAVGLPRASGVRRSAPLRPEYPRFESPARSELRVVPI